MLLPMILLATIGMLAALPHIVTADDQRQNGSAHQTDHETDHQTHSDGDHEGRRIRFDIRLAGAQQVPAITTAAFGFAEVQLSEDNSTLSFEVVVCNIANVTASQLHVGTAGGQRTSRATLLWIALSPIQ